MFLSTTKPLRYFGRGMRNSTTALKEGDGMFLSSCLDHTAGLHVGGATSINGTLSGKALGDWFYGRGGDIILRDTCDASSGDLPCNPTCDGLTPGPSPGPSPSPSPSPPSSQCGVELIKDCPKWKYPTLQKCAQCAKINEAGLSKAGCTEAAVKALCMARK